VVAASDERLLDAKQGKNDAVSACIKGFDRSTGESSFIVSNNSIHSGQHETKTVC
jgi:hypothetical protein